MPTALVFPSLFSDYRVFLGVAETFAPVMEILWVWSLAVPIRGRWVVGIVLANLTSWQLGSRLYEWFFAS